MTTDLIVWSDEKARIGQIKTKTLRAVRQWVGKCENCDTTENLTIHHCSDHWLFGIVVYCKQCHSFWHWLIDPMRGKAQKKVKAMKTTIFTIKCGKCNAEYKKSVALPDEAGMLAKKLRAWTCKECGAKSSDLYFSLSTQDIPEDACTEIKLQGDA